MVAAARELAAALSGTDTSQPWHFKAGVVPGAAELTAGLAERAGSRGEAGSGEGTGGPVVRRGCLCGLRHGVSGEDE